MPARSRRVAPGGWHPAALLRLPAPQDGHYAMDPASMLERVDENTIMVVPTLGVTYTGADEPIEAMSRALAQQEPPSPMDPPPMPERVDENPIRVAPPWGVPYPGADEPIEAMSRALDQ